MRTTQVDEDGNVRCPKCGANAFTSKRTVAGKMAAGLLAPKRLKCQGCGTNLRTGSSQTAAAAQWSKEHPPPGSFRDRANKRAAKKAANDDGD